MGPDYHGYIEPHRRTLSVAMVSRGFLSRSWAWWLIGRLVAFCPKGRGFEFRSGRNVYRDLGQVLKSQLSVALRHETPVIVISKLLKRYLKAKRTRAPAYSRALRRINFPGGWSRKAQV